MGLLQRNRNDNGGSASGNAKKPEQSRAHRAGCSLSPTDRGRLEEGRQARRTPGLRGRGHHGLSHIRLLPALRDTGPAWLKLRVREQQRLAVGWS